MLHPALIVCRRTFIPSGSFRILAASIALLLMVAPVARAQNSSSADGQDGSSGTKRSGGASARRTPPPMPPGWTPSVDYSSKDRTTGKPSATPVDPRQRFAGALQEEPTPTPSPVTSKKDPATTIVALINQRKFTRAELEARVDLVLQWQGLKKGSSLYNERRPTLYGEVLQEWTDRVLLSEVALRRGVRVTDADVARSFASIENDPELGDEAKLMLSRTGQDKSRLQAELRDALLGARLVEQECRQYSNDDYLRAAYNKGPQAFYRPAQVHLLHYSQSVENEDRQNRKALRDLIDRVGKVRDRIAEGEDPAKLAEKEGGVQLGALGTDLGWVSPAIRTFPEPVQQELPNLKKGETSDVIQNKGAGGTLLSLHVLKVVDERPEMGATFESARPLLESNLRIAVRRSILEEARKSGEHTIIVNVSGIPQRVLDKAARKAEERANGTATGAGEVKTPAAPSAPGTPAR